MMGASTRRLSALILGLAAVGVVAPLIGVYPTFLMKVWCFGLFACAFNLMIGYGGLLSLGHAAFFGGASYVTAHALKVWGWPAEATLVLGVAVGACLGFVFGALAIRRQGIYFAMTTLALAQMIYFVALRAPFTHGEDGIQAVPLCALFGVFDLNDQTTLYVMVLVIFLFGMAVVHRAIHSPFGEVLKAIRENEPRAISLGYSVERYKLAAFVLSAALAGLAGGAKVFVFQLASLTDVHWSMSGSVLLMTLLGGIGTILGPLVGAVVVLSIEYYMAETGSWVGIITGAIFVVCVLAFRRGLVGEGLALLAGRGLLSRS